MDPILQDMFIRDITTKYTVDDIDILLDHYSVDSIIELAECMYTDYVHEANMSTQAERVPEESPETLLVECIQILPYFFDAFATFIPHIMHADMYIHPDIHGMTYSGLMDRYGLDNMPTLKLLLLNNIHVFIERNGIRTLFVQALQEAIQTVRHAAIASVRVLGILFAVECMMLNRMYANGFMESNNAQYAYNRYTMEKKIVFQCIDRMGMYISLIVFGNENSSFIRGVTGTIKKTIDVLSNYEIKGIHAEETSNWLKQSILFTTGYFGFSSGNVVYHIEPTGVVSVIAYEIRNAVENMINALTRHLDTSSSQNLYMKTMYYTLVHFLPTILTYLPSLYIVIDMILGIHKPLHPIDMKSVNTFYTSWAKQLKETNT